MTVKRVFALASVVAAVAFPAFAQTRELNPTVKVLARPQSPVPAECATDPSTVPALEAEAPAMEPATAAVPPSNDLRASLRRLQVAAEGDDYAVFKSAFAEARRAVASHPPGGERNAANEALQVFTDIGRVWDYAMTSPTGSFFDASVQSGSLLNAVKRYPEYNRAIADQTVAVGGKTLYPTPETRRFLARESARRLTRLGVSTPAHVARGSQPEPLPRRAVIATPPEKKPVQVATKPESRTKATTPKKTASATTTPKKSEPKKTASKTSAPKKTEPAPVEKTAKATPPTTKEIAIKATPVPKPKPPAPPPVKIAETSTMPSAPPIVSPPQPTPRTTTTAAAPPPVQTATSAPATTTTAPPPAATSTTDTALSTTSSTPTDTSVTAAPDTAANPSAVPPSKQNGNMNLILAVVLILVGIGVLVVLFRASD